MKQSGFATCTVNCALATIFRGTTTRLSIKEGGRNEKTHFRIAVGVSVTSFYHCLGPLSNDPRPGIEKDTYKSRVGRDPWPVERMGRAGRELDGLMFMRLRYMIHIGCHGATTGGSSSSVGLRRSNEENMSEVIRGEPVGEVFFGVLPRGSRNGNGRKKKKRKERRKNLGRIYERKRKKVWRRVSVLCSFVAVPPRIPYEKFTARYKIENTAIFFFPRPILSDV